MNYIIYFDYAAVLLSTILILFFTPKISIPSRSNRIFRALMVFTVLSAAVDIFTVFQYRNPYAYPLSILYITNIIYLVVWNCIPPAVVVYAYSFLASKSGHSATRWIHASIPYLVLAILIITTPFTKLIFYFDEARVYNHGALHIVAYVSSSIYMIAIIIVAVINRRELGKRRVFAVASFCVMMLFGMVIQILNSDILILHFFAACSCLVMYMALQNAETNIDVETGLYNRETFIAAVSDMIRQQQDFAVISIIPDNLQSIRHVYGLGAYNLFLKKLGEFMGGSVKERAFLVEDASVACICDERRVQECTELIRNRFGSAWNLGNVEISRTCSISVVPSSIAGYDTSSLLDAVSYSINTLKKSSNGQTIFVNESTRSGVMLDELEKQKLLLEEESREANMAKERAEKADREKSMFLANMSHEIRTPMNAIMGMTELILRDDINERVRRNAGDIKSAGDSLLSIINDILDISKVESGKMEIANEEYDFRKLVTDFVNLISTRIDSTKVDFRINIDSDIPEKLYGDEIRVRQIFINLLNNAAKFTSEGLIGLNITGHEEQGKYILHAEITDTGCGIKEEDMDKLFSSFARIEDSKNRFIEGTGLGLPLCKKLLMIMGGDIRVESTYGKGSSFIFDLPQNMGGRRTLRDVALEKQYNIIVITEGLEMATGREVKLLCDALDQLESDYRVCCSCKDVEAAMVGKKITHVFTYRSLYEDYADWLKNSSNPEIIIFDEPGLEFGDIPDSLILHDPIYTLSVFRLIEGTGEGKKSGSETFKAPDAKILVVDDNAVNIKVIEGMLRMFDIVPDTAVCGKDAIELVRNKDYDIVFMDHMMPVMDGVETTHIIRKMGGTRSDMPIIALTANAVYGVRNMFLSEGFTEYLSKPVPIQKITACLRRFLPRELVISCYVKQENEEPISASKNEKGVPVVRGLDYEAGLANFGNNRAKYDEQLQIYYGNGVIQLEQMDKLFTSGNYRNLKIEVHTLRTMSASMGANGITSLAKSVEDAIAAGDTERIETGYRELKSELSALIDGLAAYVRHE